MAEASTANTPASGRLFSGIKFWVAHQIPQRSWFIDNMRRNGADIVPLEKQADMCLVDHARKVLPLGDGYFSYKFVEDSIRKGTLEDPEQHRVGIQSRAQRPVGSVTYAGKRTKTAFTEADDQILYNCVVPFRDAGGKWKGNAIYKQIEEKYPHHTYQSWRSRFIDIVQYQVRTLTTRPALDAHQQEQEERGPQRSPKRRRLNGTAAYDGTHHGVSVSRPVQSINAPLLHPGTGTEDKRLLRIEREPRAETELQGVQENNTGRGQSSILPGQEPGAESNASLGPDPEEAETTRIRGLRQTLPLNHPINRPLKQRILALGFTIEQARSMYIAVPDVCNTKPENLDGAWGRVASNFDSEPTHTPEEWRKFYDTLILPVYMQRNRLANQEALRHFIENVLEREERSATPKIKTELMLDARSSEDKQQIRELARARAETKRIEMSPSSSVSEERTGDGPEQDHHIPSVLRDPSPLFVPLSPTTQREVIQANEGRKRTSQQSTTTESATQPSQNVQPSQISPKKKLFGRTLDSQVLSSQYSHSPGNYNDNSLNDSATAPDSSDKSSATSSAPPWNADQINKLAGTDLQTQRPATSPVMPPQPAVSFSQPNRIADDTILIKTASKPTFQLPTSQEPPESGQRIPKSSATSQSTSQKSDCHNSANQGQIAGIVLSNSAMPHEQQPEIELPQSSPARSIGDRIDLLGEDPNKEFDLQSNHAPSDTGSEFMAFDIAPERSQLWDIPDDSNTEGEGDEEDEDPISASDIQQQSMQRRPLTPLRRLSPTKENEGIDDIGQRYESKGSSLPHSPIKRIANPVETQALFQMPLERNSSAFDVPAPEGGWDELGVINTDDEQPDTNLGTTEPSTEFDEKEIDEYIELVKEQVSSASSEKTTSSVSEHSHDLLGHTKNTKGFRIPIVISSASSGETESTASDTDQKRKQHRRQPQTPPHPRSLEYIASETESATQSESESELESSSSTGTTPKNSDIQTWFRSQRAHHSTLSNPIFHRLASTAAQATTLNLSAAALVLRIMAARFIASEDQHRAQDKAFKPKKALSEEEARRLVPDDDWGVWTIEDDRNLLSTSAEGVKKVEDKHGVDGARRRSRFLRARYRADDSETDGVGWEVAREALMASGMKIKAELK